MNTTKTIAIIGLGYVGLPLAVAFAKKNHNVIAYDISKNRIDQLKAGIDLTRETTKEDLTLSHLDFTCNEPDLAQASLYIVTVPTPINDANRPDLSLLLDATQTVGRYLKKGDIVVYESTVYPGVTEKECVPILEATSGLHFKEDFGVAYSPERINPGDKLHRLETITKIVSGSDDKVLEHVAGLYGDIVEAGIYKCPNILTAEAAKVIENIQRDVNISLINEFSIIFNKLGVNTYDVIDAACTKWNFIRFEPGLVGGHCIGVDPYYLTHCAEKLGYNPEIILSGRRLNNSMGEYTAGEIMKTLLKSSPHDVFPPTITILGMTFKENVPDTRNTKIVDMIQNLQSFGAHVQIHDPHAQADHVFHEHGIPLTALDDLAPAHAVVVAVKHQEFLERGWPFITSLLKNGEGLVADLKNCLKRKEAPATVTLWSL